MNSFFFRHRSVLRVLVVSAFMLFGQQTFAGSVNYTYDTLGRLATLVYSNGVTTTTVTYTYDAAGNRTSVTTTSS